MSSPTHVNSCQLVSTGVNFYFAVFQSAGDPPARYGVHIYVSKRAYNSFGHARGIYLRLWLYMKPPPQLVAI